MSGRSDCSTSTCMNMDQHTCNYTCTYMYITAGTNVQMFADTHTLMFAHVHLTSVQSKCVVKTVSMFLTNQGCCLPVFCLLR